ncbi:N-acetylmuramidase family protein [Brenneria tiliae]|uniref:N-acetylmuramidase family protein n=1 Tax=Brenneria tiliae TaxID=2914984 RepID=A0ABT0MNZ0_9GAMM|nr:N-acetylmuramidase family protein [Brenneria tiliae]MCL2891546.1 N-acetylmuramidase family protein [Brenneria tiliae]
MVQKSNLPPLLSNAVGMPGKSTNYTFDVMIVQYLFNLIKPLIQYEIPEDGICSATLIRTISQFQSIHLKFQHPDGVIEPVGRTFSGLIEKASRVANPMRNKPSHPNIMLFPQNDSQTNQTHKIVDNYLMNVRHTSINSQLTHLALASPGLNGSASLTDQDFINAVGILENKVDINVIRAFATVESGGKEGFSELSLPVIAYEGHIFRKYSQRKYDQTHPLLSYSYKKKAGPEWQKNNANQRTAWNTLVKAYELDDEAALKATSWGMFQIMGFNHAACGYKDVFIFVNAMKANAGNHLNAFLKLCQSNAALLSAMQRKDFKSMAYNYNGKDYGDYDIRMQRVYDRLSGKK